MDPTAVWTALGVVVAAVIGVAALIVGVMTSEIVSLRRQVRQLEQERTDYLLRMTEAEHARREAEQIAANAQARQRIRSRKDAEKEP